MSVNVLFRVVIGIVLLIDSRQFGEMLQETVILKNDFSFRLAQALKMTCLVAIDTF